MANMSDVTLCLTLLMHMNDLLSKIQTTIETSTLDAALELVDSSEETLWSGLDPLIDFLLSAPLLGEERRAFDPELVNCFSTMVEIAKYFELVEAEMELGEEINVKAAIAITADIKEKVETCINPIVNRQLAEAAKENGQPMCIGYKPWTYRSDVSKVKSAE